MWITPRVHLKGVDEILHPARFWVDRPHDLQPRRPADARGWDEDAAAELGRMPFRTQPYWRLRFWSWGVRGGVQSLISGDPVNSGV
jgi:hypothetical protein